MPTWGEMLKELQESAQQRGGQPDFDALRRKYLAHLYAKTGRDTIVYATDWLSGRAGGGITGITLEDMQGMMEVCHGLRGPELDVILHSPGGSAEATASIVRYLRRKFTDIRVFVPLAAMSAATMWALAGNAIVMGKHSQLGPIDPQFVTPQGQFPARALIKQFERIKQECAENPANLGAWLPTLQQYGPALLEEAEIAERLARRLVQEWLEAYMFAGQRGAKGKAEKIAAYFADYDTHQSHGLGIDRDQARDVGVTIIDLESDQELQDAILSAYHATIHTFSGAAVKIIENHNGRAFVKLAQTVQVQIPVMQGPAPAGFGIPGVPLPVQGQFIPDLPMTETPAQPND